MLGLATGQSSAAGGLEGVMSGAALEIMAGLFVCVLEFGAAITRRGGPAIAAVALVAAFLVAVEVYPGGKFILGSWV